MRMSLSAWPLEKPAQPRYLLYSQLALQARPTTLHISPKRPSIWRCSCLTKLIVLYSAAMCRVSQVFECHR